MERSIHPKNKSAHSGYRDQTLMIYFDLTLYNHLVLSWATRNLFILFQGKDGRPILPSRMMLVLLGRPQQEHRT